MTMTVQQLIDELQAIQDKSLPVLLEIDLTSEPFIYQSAANTVQKVDAKRGAAVWIQGTECPK